MLNIKLIPTAKQKEILTALRKLALKLEDESLTDSSINLISALIKELASCYNNLSLDYLQEKISLLFDL